MNDLASLARDFDKRAAEVEEYELMGTYSGESLDEASSGRRSSRTSNQSSRSSIGLISLDSGEDQEQIVSFFEGLGWKRIVFIPHNTMWRHVLIVTIILHFLILVYGYHFTNDETKIIFYTHTGIAILVAIESMYFIDTALAIIYKNWKSIHKLNVNPPRPTFQILCDVFAVVPIEYMYWNLSSAMTMRTRVHIYYCLTPHSLVRIYRIFAFFAYVRNSLSYNIIWMRVLEIFTYSCLISHACSAILFIFYCIKEDEICYSKENDWSKMFIYGNMQTDVDWYITSLYVMLGVFTSKAYGFFTPQFLSLLIFGFVFLVAFVLIYGFMMGQLVSGLIQDWQYIFSFADRLKKIQNMLIELRVTKKVKKDIITYYQVLWENRGGVHQKDLHYELLPNILHRDLNLDIFGDAFKRSHLLRTANETFLSFLSLKMKAEFYMTGDLLYRKGKVKSKMIYLINGIIQILSDEDDESPLMSFSGGTCLGEAALVLHCVSKVVVRCATYCEVQVLEKSDFVNVLRNYPHLQKSLGKMVKERIVKSKELKRVGRKGLDPADVVQLDDNNENAVKWFKNFFLGSTKHRRKRKSGLPQSTLQFTDINTDVHRTVAYMGLYVYTERFELAHDDVCLRTTCPWILHPKSTVVHVWNNVIVIITILTAAFLPYYAFYAIEKPNLLKTVMFLVDIFFVSDVLIQTCTAIKTKTEVITQWKEIFYIRLSEFSFIADVVTAFPFQIMAYMIRSDGNRDYETIFMLTNLIKLWKVERSFQEQEARQIKMAYFLKEVKYVCYLVYSIYIFGGIFYFQSCFHDACEKPGWYNLYHTELNPGLDKGAYRNFTLSTLYSATLIIGNSITTIMPVTIADLVLSIIAMLLSFVFLVYIFSASAAMEILRSKSWSLFQDTYRSITKYMDEHNMEISLQRRVLSYLDFCWAYDDASSLISGRSAVFDLTPYLLERMYGPALLPYFDIPLLKGSDPQFIYQLAKMCTSLILPPNEVVVYSGEPATCAYLILKGYCRAEAKLTKNNSVNVFGPHTVFNDLEMCLHLPTINKVQTITCCHILQVDMATLMMVIQKYPNSESIFTGMLEIYSEFKDKPELKAESDAQNIFTTIQTEENKSSWFKFISPLSVDLDHPEDSDYMEPFAKLLHFSFIRFFLLRRTMVPNGWFIIGWEISRGVFAFLSALLFPAAGALEVYTFPWIKYVRYGLDATAYADLYLRLHVAFYNHQGIVVTHPLATAKHYLTHGFLLDVLAVFPFELFALGSDGLTLYYCLLFNRIFQIRRLICLLLYSKLYSRLARDIPTLLSGSQFLCVGIITCNVIGGVFVFFRCEYTLADTVPEMFGKGVFCDKWTYALGDLRYAEPISPVRVYLYNVYIVTSLITKCGVAVTMISRNNTALGAVALSVFGLVFLKFMNARIIALTAAVDVKTTEHQERMKSLLNFITDKRISKDLRVEVVNYFETLWKRKRAMDAYTTFNGFNLTLKEDVFLHVYGRRLLECPVFASANRSFLCHLILSSHVEIFLRGSTILRPYETTTTIYFVNKGRVDLIAAGNVKVCSSLTVGCMFGNMLNAPNYSQNLTVVARGHAEVLAIPCKLFHKNIELHGKIQKAFINALTRSTSDFYLSTKPDTTVVEEDSLKSILDSTLHPHSSHIKLGESAKSGNYAKFCGWGRVYLPGSAFVKVMLVIQLIASYLAFVGAMYFKARQEDSIYFLSCLYAFDAVFYIRIYMNFKLAYYDEFGYLVTDQARIAARYVSLKTTKIGLLYDVAAVLPIEAFGLLAPESYRMTVISNLHFNRVLAITYVLRWFWNENRKLNINVFLIRLGLIVIWTTVTLQIIAWFFGILECLETDTCGQYRDLSPLKRLERYTHELWIILCMFIGSAITPEELMPNSVYLIIYCIFVMMFTRVMVAFSIGQACAIVQSSYRAMTRYTRMVTALCNFYSMNDLCPPLRVQLWSYLEQLWRMKGGQQVPQLLNEAPYYLREAIKTVLYGDYVRRNALFAECHEDFMRQLVTCLKQYIFFPGNYITFAGDVDDNMYFVYSGEVEFLIPSEMDEGDDVRGVLVEGDAFGMIQGVYPRREHAYNYRARTVALLLILNRPDWETMLVSFPAVKKEIFSKAADFEFRF